jgi:F-box/WD-40 domain protein 7
MCALQGNRTCPVTGMRLRHLELTPNFALRNAIMVRLFSCSANVCTASRPVTEGC